MEPTTIASLILSVLGLSGTAYFGRKSVRLEHRIRRYDWEDVMTGVRMLSKQPLVSFQPHCFLSASAPGAIVANLLLVETGSFLPAFSCIAQPVRGATTLDHGLGYSQIATTSRWKLHVPDEMFSSLDRRILICEDCVVTGETLTKLVELLCEKGFDRQQIRTAALFVSELAVASGVEPDYYWMKVQDSEFYMPWGKSLGRGYR